MKQQIANWRITSEWLFYLLFISLISIFLFLTLGSIFVGHLSLTYDEPQHYRYGEMIYQLESDRFDDSKMPISVLNVIPAKIADRLFGKYFNNEWQVMSVGKISTIFTSLLLGFLTFSWVKALYGKWVGLVGFGLYIFEPNMIANSQLITTDLYAAATVTFMLFTFWRFMKGPNLRLGIVAGVALGLAQIAKYSSLLLFPILFLLTVLRYGDEFISNFKRRSFVMVWQALLSLFKYTALIMVFSVFVINLGFLFNRTGATLNDYSFKSNFFQSVQHNFKLLSKIPIPLPYPYLEGLDFVIFRERTGDGYGNIYLLGELRKGTGFAGYYFFASLLKIPLAIQGFFIFALWDWFRNFNRKEFLKKEMVLLVPALVYAIYFNFLNQAQIGIRFYLVIFPIFLIFTSRIFRKWFKYSIRSRIFLGVAGIFLIASVFSYFPHYLPYFNELVPNRSFAYHYLADSNIDWGQNRANLADFLIQNPDYQFQPDSPTTGVIVVGVNELTGVIGDPQKYQWLRENFEPIGNFNYSYLIYDISPESLLKIR